MVKEYRSLHFVQSLIISYFSVPIPQALRPLACSTLADLVHHVRGELGMHHLSRVVYIFSCNIHDSTLPLSIQVRLVVGGLTEVE